jgi:hypothetical protein
MALTDLHLILSRKARNVIEASARNILVTHNVPGGPEVGNLLRKCKNLTGPHVGRVIDTVSSDIAMGQSPSGESAQEDAVTDL